MGGIHKMNKWLKRLKKDEQGLTLVELLAVVVILAIVAAIAFVLIGNVIDNSKTDAHIANANQLISSAKLYEASGNEIDAEDGVTSGVLQAEDLLGVFVDPWNKEAYEGTVTKEKDDEDLWVYRVELDSNDSSKCESDELEAVIIKGDRGEICGTE